MNELEKVPTKLPNENDPTQEEKILQCIDKIQGLTGFENIMKIVSNIVSEYTKNTETPNIDQAIEILNEFRMKCKSTKKSKEKNIINQNKNNTNIIELKIGNYKLRICKTIYISNEKIINETLKQLIKNCDILIEELEK